MPHGAESRKRKWKEQHEAKKALKKAARSSASLRDSSVVTTASGASITSVAIGPTAADGNNPVACEADMSAAAVSALISNSIPTITEDDLLAFQYSHFGDPTKPETFFVSAEDALDFEPEYDEQHEDLGYYQDGAKRTLTDEQIALFRHSEIQQLLREARLKQAAEGEALTPAHDKDHTVEEEDVRSLSSNTSSFDGDLVGLAKAPLKRRPLGQQQRKPPRSQRSERSRRSETPRFIGPQRPPRQQEVPYDERHKRKWEDFIEENDPEQGSMTHRRLVRELDEHKTQELDMDYGDDTPPPAKLKPSTKPVAAPAGRRVVSYADD